jgi:hypothetical protein
MKVKGGDKKVEGLILNSLFLALISVNMRRKITSLTLRQSTIQNTCEPFHFLKNAMFLKCLNIMIIEYINRLRANCTDASFLRGSLA